MRDVFEITENYLFRRNICEVPTNALNKVFLTLNKEILRYDNTAGNYVDKCIYALRAKRESGRFPDDREFSDALAVKQVYLMRGKYKAYLFERFENFGTVETKDVYAHLDDNEYSIEHIMPQHLTPAWTEELGPNASEIHATWLHRLANLTLTGYNPNLSNKSFREKRDEKKGYKDSGLRMNQKIGQKDAWGLPELEERSGEMVARALQIWPCPQTDFKPAEKEFDSCTLDDEDVDLTGREIVKYSLLSMEQPAASWTDMFEHVVKFLHQKDKSVLSVLACSTDQVTDLAGYVSGTGSELRSALQIDDTVYFEKNTSTALKLSILRRLFVLYGVDPMELVFYLKDPDSEKAAEASRFDLRRRYWTYALPLIQKQHMHRGSFGNVSPGTSNTVAGFFGISGCSVQCIANYDGARIDFYLGSGDAAWNKASFDLLHSHKDEIEEELGISLNWVRADQYKASWISYELKDVSIADEGDWPRMARFHAEWSDAICNAVLPYLQNEDELEQRLSEIAGILREWTVSRPEAKENLAKCNRTLTRFTTDQMSEIFPRIGLCDDINGLAAAEGVQLFVNDSLVLAGVERLHIDDHHIDGTVRSEAVHLGEPVGGVDEEPDLLAILPGEVFLSGLEGLVDALPDGHRRHHNDELAPAVAGVELVHGFYISIGLAGARLHLNGQVDTRPGQSVRGLQAAPSLDGVQVVQNTGVGQFRHQRVVPEAGVRHVQVSLDIGHITQIQAVGGGAHGLAVEHIADRRSCLRLKGLVFELKFHLIIPQMLQKRHLHFEPVMYIDGHK